jgi:EAL domain-containing protein (putative c-di-GMP-specific phosphodiesterase class I)/GGDEF domain-containing protein
MPAAHPLLSAAFGHVRSFFARAADFAGPARIADGPGVRPPGPAAADAELQASTLALLHRQAHVDPGTGVATRRAFVGRLGALLQAETLTGAGLLIVRVLDLPGMHRRLGAEAAERLLGAVALALRPYARRVPGALAGRLNGADFALALPARGAVAETAAALTEALRASLARVDPQADLRIGGVELDAGQATAAALAAADEALARAETGRAFAIEVFRRGAGDALGEGLWQTRLAAALEAGELQLGEFPFVAADGALLHLECPLRLRFGADGPWEPADRWLAPAVRCGLVGRIDLAALGLALQATARDRRPRAVHVAAASLAVPGFVDAVRQRLGAEPQAAGRLWIDVAESAATRRAEALSAACSAWRGAGARVGLEHGGHALHGLARLPELGLDYVKLEAGWLQGLPDDRTAGELLRASVGLLHGLRLQVLAEGVAEPALLESLWSLGLDGAGGPAVGPG